MPNLSNQARPDRLSWLGKPCSVQTTKRRPSAGAFALRLRNLADLADLDYRLDIGVVGDVSLELADYRRERRHKCVNGITGKSDDGGIRRGLVWGCCGYSCHDGNLPHGCAEKPR